MSGQSADSSHSGNESGSRKSNIESTADLAVMDKEGQRAHLSALIATMEMGDEKHTVEGNTAVTPETEASGITSRTESAMGQEQLKLLRLLSEITDRESFIHHMENPKYVKVFRKKRGLKQFRKIFLAQELVVPSDDDRAASGQKNGAAEGSGKTGGGKTQASASNERDKPILFIKFSKDGKYMATGGKGYQLHIWKVIASPMERWGLDNSQDKNRSRSKTVSLSSSNLCKYSKRASCLNGNASGSEKKSSLQEINEYMYAPVFHPTPFKTFSEHTQSILDCDWSKNGFILTASMDKYAKLWHCERKTSLKSFIHPDFVTCIRFHPSDDRYFLTGCLDHVLRIWSILEDKVAFEYDCKDLITSMDISEHGKYTIIGTFNGYIHILNTKGLQECHSFHVLDKSSPSKDKTRRGPKITGIQFLKGGTRLKAMVTSNDSRIRIFDVEAACLLEKLHGFTNAASQLSAHHTQLDDGLTLVLSGSEDHWIYGWILRSDRPNSGSLEASRNHNRTDSTSVKSDDSSRWTDSETTKSSRRSSIRLSGTLKQFFKKTMSINNNGSSEKLNLRKIHRSQGTDDKCVKNSVYLTFHAQHHPLTAAVTAPKETCQVLSLSNDLICEMTAAFWDKKSDYLLAIPPKNKAKDYGSDTAQASSRRGSEDSALRVPTMMQSIGMITVSADVMGNIMVFRNDISTNIRTKFLKILRDNISATSIPGDHKIPEASSSTLNKSSSFSKRAAANGINRLTRPDDVSSSSVASSLKLQHLQDIPTDEAFASVAITGDSSNRICDVCGGDRIASHGPVFRKDKAQYCLECGNEVNRFR